MIGSACRFPTYPTIPHIHSIVRGRSGFSQLIVVRSPIRAGVGAAPKIPRDSQKNLAVGAAAGQAVALGSRIDRELLGPLVLDATEHRGGMSEAGGSLKHDVRVRRELSQLSTVADAEIPD